MKNKKLLIGVFLGFFSGIIVFLSNRHGIGVSPDSTFYISAADKLKNTGELRDIWKGAHLDYMTHYPPGYSIVIALFSTMFTNIYTAINALNIFLFISFVLIVYIEFKNTMSLLSMLFLSMFIIFSLPLLNIYEMAWSEGLFIPLSFLSLFVFNKYLQSKSLKWLIYSSCIVSFAVFTRYIGITLILTMSLFLLFNRVNFKKKIISLFIFNSISGSLLVYWFFRNFLLTDNVASRDISYHPMGIAYYMEFFESIKQLFIQLSTTSDKSIVIGGVLFIGILLFSYLVVKVEKPKINLNSLLISYFFITLVFLFISNTFFDFTPLYFRIITPYLLGVLIVLVAIADKKLPFKIKGAVYGLFILMQVFFASRNIVNRTDGREYNNKRFKEVSTNSYINTLDFNKTLVFTNEVDRVYYLTSKIAYWIKNTEDFKTDNRPKIIILYNNGRSYSEHLNIIERKKIKLLKETEDARIYLEI